MIPPMPPKPKSIISVSLKKPLGLTLEENEILGLEGGVHVVAVAPNGNAARCSSVTVGMILMEICGVDVSDLDFDQIMDLLITAPEDEEIDLVFASGVEGMEESDYGEGSGSSASIDAKDSTSSRIDALETVLTGIETALNIAPVNKNDSIGRNLSPSRPPPPPPPKGAPKGTSPSPNSAMSNPQPPPPKGTSPSPISAKNNPQPPPPKGAPKGTSPSPNSAMSNPQPPPPKGTSPSPNSAKNKSQPAPPKGTSPPPNSAMGNPQSPLSKGTSQSPYSAKNYPPTPSASTMSSPQPPPPKGTPPYPNLAVSSTPLNPSGQSSGVPPPPPPRRNSVPEGQVTTSPPVPPPPPPPPRTMGDQTTRPRIKTHNQPLPPRQALPPKPESPVETSPVPSFVIPARPGSDDNNRSVVSSGCSDEDSESSFGGNTSESSSQGNVNSRTEDSSKNSLIYDPPAPLPLSISTHSVISKHPAHSEDEGVFLSSGINVRKEETEVSAWQEARAPTPPPRPASHLTNNVHVQHAGLKSVDTSEASSEVALCSQCRMSFTYPNEKVVSVPSENHSPRMLNCLHSYCASCLYNMWKKNGVSVTCPACKVVTTIGVNGVMGLPSPFLLLRGIPNVCGNCEENPANWKCCQCSADCALLCDSCQSVHVSMKAFRSHQIVPLSVRNDNRDVKQNELKLCKKHTSKFMDVYCVDCEEVICMTCAVFDHSSHSVVPLLEGRDIEADSISSTIENMRQKVERGNISLMHLQSLLLSLDGKKSNIIEIIENLFQGLRTALQMRESEVLSTIDQQYEEKVNELNGQLTFTELAMELRQHVLTTAENFVFQSNDYQLLDVASLLKERISSLNKEHVASMPMVTADMALISGSDVFIRSMMPSVGMLRGSHWTASPEKCCVDDVKSGLFNNLWWLEVKVSLVNADGVPLACGGHPISFEVVNVEGLIERERDSSAVSKIDCLKKRRFSSRDVPSAEAVAAQLENVERGRFIIDDMQGGFKFIFFSNKSCLLSAHVKVFGKHIFGSPTSYTFGCLGTPTIVFGPKSGSVLFASSVLTINGWPDANSPENLRVMNTSSGWLTEGQGTETVVLGFNAVVALHQVRLLNWAARRYQVAVRKFDPTADENTEEEWICLSATPAPTQIRAGVSKSWLVTLSPEERDDIGPIDALRLDISEGNNTAFYGVNIEGWVLYEGCVNYYTSFDDE